MTELHSNVFSTTRATSKPVVAPASSAGPRDKKHFEGQQDFPSVEGSIPSEVPTNDPALANFNITVDLQEESSNNSSIPRDNSTSIEEAAPLTVALMRVGSDLLPVMRSSASGQIPESRADASSDEPLQIQSGSAAFQLFGQDPPAYPRLGATFTAPGVVEMVAAAPGTNRLFSKTLLQDGRIWTGLGWHSLAIQFQGSPSICRLREGELMVAVLGLDNKLWWALFTISRQGWWGMWHTISEGEATSGPHLVCQDGGRVLMLARNTGGGVALAESLNSGSAWAWMDLAGDVKEGSSISAAVASADHDLLNIVVRGSDDHLWQLVLAGGEVTSSWRQLATLGKVTSSPALMAAASLLTVTVRGEDATTYWSDTSEDGGKTFNGKWKSWSYGFESSPLSLQLQEGNKSITLGVNQRGEIALRETDSVWDGGLAWVAVSALPLDTSGFVAEKGGNFTPSLTRHEKVETSCQPCALCEFYDMHCWESCSLACTPEEACVLEKNQVQEMAAQQSCNYVWRACGSPADTPIPTSSGSMFPNFNITQVGFRPDADHLKLCQLRAENFCTTTVWRTNLYKVTSRGYAETCGHLVYHGNQRCQAAYVYNLFKALTKASCSESTKEFYAALQQVAFEPAVLDETDAATLTPASSREQAEIVWKDPGAP
eukprot:scaffold18026_cov34-Prasinocladus_malaysianus.AAC.1